MQPKHSRQNVSLLVQTWRIVILNAACIYNTSTLVPCYPRVWVAGWLTLFSMYESSLYAKLPSATICVRTRTILREMTNER